MRLVLLAPVLLLACPATAQSVAEPYRAVGTEPFWSLSMDGGSIRYEPATGRAITVSQPQPTMTRSGRQYRTATLTVDITRARCSDGMSDRTYADTVTLRVAGRQLRGCGGAIVGAQADALTGTWRIGLVNGRAVQMERPATLTFAGDRVSGRICNAFGGAYRLARGTLTTREIIGTQMACMGEPGRIEAAVFAALRTPLKVHRGSRADTLVLANGRSSLTLRRER